MSYSLRRRKLADGTEIGEVLSGSTPVLSMDVHINQRLAGHLFTPAFFDNPNATVQTNGNGSVVYVNALLESGGKWTFDLPTKRAICAAASVDEVVKEDEDRPEISAGLNAVKALFPGKDDAWAKAYLRFHRQFDLYNAG